MRAANLVERLRRHSFRAFVHPPKKQSWARGTSRGSCALYRDRGAVWEIAATPRGIVLEMAEIGLFPLGIVLLPTEQVPLHIFEDRYKELIDECLAEREFGLVYADDDGLRPVGTLAAVTEVIERFDDGRLNVVVEGRARFRVVELTSGRSFFTAEVEPVEDQADQASEQDVERALTLFHRLVELTGRRWMSRTPLRRRSRTRWPHASTSPRR